MQLSIASAPLPLPLPLSLPLDSPKTNPCTTDAKDTPETVSFAPENPAPSVLQWS